MGYATGPLLHWLGILSIVTFSVSLMGVPWLILRMPPDYFIRHRSRMLERHRRHPVLTVFLFCLRNGIGVLLLAAGTAMLILPGQGILTLLIGISVMDFPGRHRLLERCVAYEKVQKSLNWIRRKGGKGDFLFAS